MENIIESFDYKGIAIDIAYDEYPFNPFSHDERLGDIVSNLRKYTIGKYQLSSGYASSFKAFKAHIAEQCFAVELDDLPSNWDDQIVFRTVYACIHGRISLSIDDNMNAQYDGFDSGIAGFIYATKETIRKWFGVKNVTAQIKDRVVIQFRNETKALQAHLNGEIYLAQADCDEAIACGGFYSIDDAIAYAKEDIDAFVVKSEQKRLHKLKVLIKEKCPIMHRQKVLVSL